jgi:hypothetical protein
LIRGDIQPSKNGGNIFVRATHSTVPHSFPLTSQIFSFLVATH